MGVGRAIATSLLAFVISGFAGGLVAQWLAVSTGAGEEFILVFLAIPLMTTLATIVFFVAQLMSNPIWATRLAGIAMIGILVALAIFLVGVSYFDTGGREAVSRDTPLIAGLVGSNLVTIAVHWLFVRWRLRPRAAVATISNE